MVERDQIRQAVFRAIERLKELSLDESALPSDESGIVLGNGAGLDSMGFVNFLVALEDEISQVTDEPWDLVSKVNSSDVETEPLSTVGEFIDFVHNSVQCVTHPTASREAAQGASDPSRTSETSRPAKLAS